MQPCLHHPLPILRSQYGSCVATFFFLFYAKNSIYYNPLNWLAINWCLITYVAVVRERDICSRSCNWLAEEWDRETDSHIRQHRTVTIVSGSSFICPRTAEMMSVPKTLRTSLQTACCWETGLTSRAPRIRVALIIRGNGTRTHTYTRTQTVIVLNILAAEKYWQVHNV
jgi:hypothetical protein